MPPLAAFLVFPAQVWTFKVLKRREYTAVNKTGALLSSNKRILLSGTVKQKEGKLKTFSGTGGIGIVSGRLALEGPIIKDKTSFLLAGRSSYSNWLLRKMPDISIRNSRATFYDVSAKISHAFNARNKLGFTFYSSSDDFGFTRDHPLSMGKHHSQS